MVPFIIGMKGYFVSLVLNFSMDKIRRNTYHFPLLATSEVFASHHDADLSDPKVQSRLLYLQRSSFRPQFIDDGIMIYGGICSIGFTKSDQFIKNGISFFKFILLNNFNLNDLS